MEQQRLFAWSETSGLMDLNATSKEPQKVLESNTFILHRTTVLDLLVQVQWLFKEFEEKQREYARLRTAPEQDDILDNPEKDADAAHFPLPEKRRNFIKKAMMSLKEKSKEGYKRLEWVSFHKVAFEALLTKFSALNDNMTDILDARLQVEIHHTVQDTNRGVLQLHDKITDLGRLVMALTLKLEKGAPINPSQWSRDQREKNAEGLEQLSKLAKFKAFNESIKSGEYPPLDEATKKLELGERRKPRDLRLDKSMIELDPEIERQNEPRSEAILIRTDGTRRKVWVEWKEYEWNERKDGSPSKDAIIKRVQKLAALLNHSPKPEAFRTLHCVGFFDKADSGDGDDDKNNHKLGLVFERPQDNKLHSFLPPISLRDLLESDPKPRVTERIKLAHAIANCVHYLHAVNWLHKGLSSHNIVFFRTTEGTVDYTRPYLSGFDLSRPARDSEFTDFKDDVEQRLYRHPLAQNPNADERERFRKAFDVYSLGVLFVEIAHWETVYGVLGINMNALYRKPRLALEVRDKLLERDRIVELGASMGEVFENAARRCIAGAEEDGKKVTESDDFYEKVVKTLGEVRV
jgi:hypothetical protein